MLEKPQLRKCWNIVVDLATNSSEHLQSNWTELILYADIETKYSRSFCRKMFSCSFAQMNNCRSGTIAYSSKWMERWRWLRPLRGSANFSSMILCRSTTSPSVCGLFTGVFNGINTISKGEETVASWQVFVAKAFSVSQVGLTGWGFCKEFLRATSPSFTFHYILLTSQSLDIACIAVDHNKFTFTKNESKKETEANVNNPVETQLDFYLKTEYFHPDNHSLTTLHSFMRTIQIPKALRKQQVSSTTSSQNGERIFYC